MKILRCISIVADICRRSRAMTGNGLNVTDTNTHSNPIYGLGSGANEEDV